MEIRIRTAKAGEELACGYTGEVSTVLVKLAPDDDVEKETGWIGISALQQAMRLISSVTGVSVPAFPQQAAVGPAVAPQAPGEPIVGSSPAKDPPETKDRFERDLTTFITRESIEDEKADVDPATGERPTYMPEVKLGEFLRQRASYFRNPVAVMLPALAKHVGMNKARLELVLKAEG